MKLPIYQVDAFTRRTFGGNPAAVVVLESWLSDRLLQAIAAENNLSETAFCVAEGNHWQVRWFTPGSEVDLCGHATLACAHVLFNNDYANQQSEVHFVSKSGPLMVRRDGYQLEMDFPSRPPTACAVPEGLAAALGATPQVVCGNRDLMAVFPDERTVKNLKVDFALLEGLPCFAVIATAPGDEVDFVSRFFAPKVGVPEDPVTGSAHCTLVPYWAERLGKDTLSARQVSRRGGELHCRLKGDRVLISGHCVDYLKGEIFIEEETH